jgi:hypothetical protein
MYLHLGQAVMVPSESVVGIFDLDNTTASKITQKFLEGAQDASCLVNIAEDIPKSFVVCRERDRTTVYLSQLSTQTLLRRASDWL